MSKQRTFICYGAHRIMKVQAQTPKGWRLERVKVDRDQRYALMWFCPACLATLAPGKEGT